MLFTNTQGGWEYRKDVSDKTFYIETADKEHTKTFIGEIGGGLHTSEEIEANAKLVSCAPDLLNFLMKYYRYLNLSDQKLAKDLILKAGGSV